MSKLRIYDQISQNRADIILAGSKNAQRRIKKIYKKDSNVLYPFVDFEKFKNTESFDGGYLLVISRLNKYKKVELAILACKELGLRLKVIGSGSQLRSLNKLGGEVEFLHNLEDETVIKVLSGCRALIMPGVEDFGLVALEAQALGKPVIAYKGGGALETVIDGKTGVFFENQSVESLKRAIGELNSLKIQSVNCLINAKNFSKQVFMRNFQAAVAPLV